MVLSKRERYVGMAMVAAVAIFGLDHFFVGPLLAQKKELDAKVTSAQQQLKRANRLFSTSRSMNRRWDEMVQGGLGKDASEAESQLHHKVRDWADEAGMTLSSVKTERTEREKDFVRITFRAAATGSMAQITRFLWQIQTADVPIRVVDLQLTTRKEGFDDLAVQIGIATSYLGPPTKTDKPASASMIRELQQ
jgi:hypothetical protein